MPWCMRDKPNNMLPGERLWAFSFGFCGSFSDGERGSGNGPMWENGFVEVDSFIWDDDWHSTTIQKLSCFMTTFRSIYR